MNEDCLRRKLLANKGCKKYGKQDLFDWLQILVPETRD
jgi:hypothetical protein